MEKKYKKLLWISIGISVGIMLIVIALTFDATTIETLKKVAWEYLAIAFALHVIALGVWGLRILVLSRSLGYKLKLFHCINMAASGQLFAAITPSSIGGEPIRIHEIYKAKVPIADATAIVLVERLLEAVLLVVGVITALVIFSIINLNGDIPEQVLILAWSGTGLFTVILGVLIFMARKPESIKRWGLKISGIFTKKLSEEKREKLNNSLTTGVDQFYSTFRHFAGKARWGIVVGFLLTILFWFIEYSIASVIMIGLGYAPNLLLSIIFQMIIAIAMMIPLTPGATGISEICYAGLYAMILPTPIIGVFVILVRAVLYYSNLILGAIGTFIIVKREAKDERVKLAE